MHQQQYSQDPDCTYARLLHPTSRSLRSSLTRSRFGSDPIVLTLPRRFLSVLSCSNSPACPARTNSFRSTSSTMLRNERNKTSACANVDSRSIWQRSARRIVSFVVVVFEARAKLTVPVSWLQYFKHSSNSTRYLMITSRWECKTARATNCSNESE